MYSYDCFSVYFGILLKTVLCLKVILCNHCVKLRSQNHCEHFVLFITLSADSGIFVQGKMEPTNDNLKVDPAIEEYAAFEEKVKRTVFVDNLSPLATEAVLKAAFNQFGDVTSVYLFPNYIEPNNTACAALVEMQTPNQAENIIYEVSNSPFMISGMPRPVRARAAEIEMFDDRPRKPGRKIELRWVAPNDPDFEVAKKMTALVRKHAAEADFLMKV